MVPCFVNKQPHKKQQQQQKQQINTIEIKILNFLTEQNSNIKIRDNSLPFTSTCDCCSLRIEEQEQAAS